MLSQLGCIVTSSLTRHRGRGPGATSASRFTCFSSHVRTRRAQVYDFARDSHRTDGTPASYLRLRKLVALPPVDFLDPPKGIRRNWIWRALA
ncbi:hypothetical protein FAIPA1_10357 [Frankia sp. AiPs1]